MGAAVRVQRERDTDLRAVIDIIELGMVTDHPVPEEPR